MVNAIIAASPIINDTPNYWDTPSDSGYHNVTSDDFSDTDLGEVSWFGAKAFTGYLNSINYAGSNHWALPSAGANPQNGYNQTGGQFGQLFYNELGGIAGSAMPDTANFTNVEDDGDYWLGTEYAPDPNLAWKFDTRDGLQFGNLASNKFVVGLSAWAVSPGQVAAVPIPGAVRLFGTGLFGLLGPKRRGHAG